MQLAARRNAAVAAGVVVGGALLALLWRRKRATRAAIEASAVASPQRYPSGSCAERFPIALARSLPREWSLGPLVVPLPGVLCRSIESEDEEVARRVEACFLAIVVDTSGHAPASDDAQLDAAELGRRLLQHCPFVAADDSATADSLVSSLLPSAGDAASTLFRVQVQRGDVTARGAFVRDASGVSFAVTVVFVGAPTGEEVDGICGAFALDASVRTFPPGELVAVVSGGDATEDRASPTARIPLEPGFVSLVDGGSRVATVQSGSAAVDLGAATVVYVNDEVGVRFGVASGSVMCEPYGAAFTVDFWPHREEMPDALMTLTVTPLPRGWELPVQADGHHCSNAEAEHSRLRHNATVHLLGPSHTPTSWLDVDVAGCNFLSVDSLQGDFCCRTLVSELKTSRLVVIRCCSLERDWAAATDAFRQVFNTMHFSSKLTQ